MRVLNLRDAEFYQLLSKKNPTIQQTTTVQNDEKLVKLKSSRKRREKK